jgi:pimeloyl-ACP methyl ester carboxylesterase
MVVVINLETKSLEQEQYVTREINPGGAKSIILVGGANENIAVLNPLAESLAEKDFRVISFDPKVGTDEQDQGRPNRHHSANIRQVGNIINKSQRSEDDKLTLVAHSQGGIFALNAALQNPDRVERVVLFGTAGLFADSIPRLAGRFALETVRKTLTPKLTAQRQQIEGIKGIARHPSDFGGDVIDISKSSVEQQIKKLQEMGVLVDIVLSNKDQVFPWRLQEDYFMNQDIEKFDFNSVSMPFSVKPNKKPHKLAGKWAGHDQPIIYPDETAELVSQIVHGR